jgi:hypothetical protein
MTVELYRSVNAQQDPDLKDMLVCGEINIVKCPKCGDIFYAEHFVLYMDVQEELIAFVYPVSFEDEREQWECKMNEEYTAIQADLHEKAYENIRPVIFFGLDTLAELLKHEELQTDEIDVFKSVHKELDIKIAKIARAEGRSNRIPHFLPYTGNENGSRSGRIKDGIEKLLKVIPDMDSYRMVLERIKANPSFLEKMEIEFLK